MKRFLSSFLLLLSLSLSARADVVRVDSVSKSNPPLLNMPFDRENITSSMFQNLIFSWTPLH
ncbi:MAG: hypothetical protein MUE53_04880, partial [Chitinophagales bacterium]|nr:hypothetical protein [Chitinophagales bacterium]